MTENSIDEIIWRNEKKIVRFDVYLFFFLLLFAVVAYRTAKRKMLYHFPGGGERGGWLLWVLSWNVFHFVCLEVSMQNVKKQNNSFFFGIFFYYAVLFVFVSLLIFLLWSFCLLFHLSIKFTHFTSKRLEFFRIDRCFILLGTGCLFFCSFLHYFVIYIYGLPDKIPIEGLLFSEIILYT